MADKSTRVPQPGDPDFDWGQYDAYKQQAGDPLAEAKQFLERKSVSDATPESDAEALALTNPKTPHASLRSLTDAMRMGGSLGLEGIEQNESMPTWGRLAAGFGKYALPTYDAALLASGAREAIAPEADESRWMGALDAGMGASGMGLVGKGLKMLKGGAEEAAPALGMAESAMPESWKQFVRQPGRESVSSEIPYASHQVAQNPNQVLDVARDVAGETGDPLDKVLRGRGGKTGQSRPSVDALMQLANSGPKPKAAAQTGYHAMDILATPHSTEYVNGEFAKNKDLAYQILGKQVDPMRALGESQDAAELSNLPNLNTGISHTLETQARQKRMKEFGDAFRQGRTFKPEF